jgi:hypothetical protein
MMRTSAPPSGELEPVEQPAAHHQFLRRLLDVQDAAPGSHPLGVAVGDQAAAAVGVLVAERAVDHVGHGLETAVRMPGSALRLTGRVVHLAHLVHVDERVEQAQVHAGERAPDREALALVARRRGGHLQDRPLSGIGAGLADSRQHGDVPDGYGWHVLILFQGAVSSRGPTLIEHATFRRRLPAARRPGGFALGRETVRSARVAPPRSGDTMTAH